jgi:hypothetical protein
MGVFDTGRLLTGALLGLLILMLGVLVFNKAQKDSVDTI